MEGSPPTSGGTQSAVVEGDTQRCSQEGIYGAGAPGGGIRRINSRVFAWCLDRVPTLMCQVLNVPPLLVLHESKGQSLPVLDWDPPWN